MSYLPGLVTERYTDSPHEAGWDACVYCSVVMLAAKVMGTGSGVRPQMLEDIDDPTRTKQGTTMSAALGALAKAAPTARSRIRYLAGQNDLLTPLLEQGQGVAVTGLYSRLPTHWQRWDTVFAAKGDASGHCVYAQRFGPGGVDHWSDPRDRSVWLLDPLATSGYAGEWLPLSALFAFIADRVWHAAGPEPPSLPDTSTEVAMPNYSVGGVRTGAVSAGTPYYTEPGDATPRSKTTVSRRYLLTAVSVDGKRVCLDGRYDEAVSATPQMCGWVDAAAVTAIETVAGVAETDYTVTTHVRSANPPAVSVTP